MKFLLYFSLLVLLSVTACEKQCINAKLRFGLIGFSDAEADTIILRRFIKNISQIPKDTFLFKQLEFNRRSDTLDMTGIPVDSYLESNYNYEVFLPGAGKLFTITDILEDKGRMTKGLFNCSKEACLNTITGYTVNGQFSNSIIDQEIIYLKK